MALKNDGTVWGWGRNDFGQLGDVAGIDKATPVNIVGLNGITAMAGGLYQCMALGNDGIIWVRGGNLCGEYGNGTAWRIIPAQVVGPGGVGHLNLLQ